MNRRRPTSEKVEAAAARKPVAGHRAGSGGAPILVWYTALIGIVLLLAALAYIYILHQERSALRQAADQLTIGQELLRADRDDVLENAREREAALSLIEVESQQDRDRLERVEDQRDRLQKDVLRLTQELAENRGRAKAPENGAAQAEAFRDLEREQARLNRDLAGRKAEIEDLKADISQKDEELADKTRALATKAVEAEAMLSEVEALKTAKAGLEGRADELGHEIEVLHEGSRQRQILRGHQASLGDVNPYIAEVGPEDWRVMEDWLAQQLRRPMALPDLAEHGWTYEGARLLGSSDGPPMAMLLYADAEERPVSLTVTRDQRGEQDLVVSELGGLNILEWREERHAFTLASDVPDDQLRPIALQLMGEPPVQREEASVPVSRYIRPTFRP